MYSLRDLEKSMEESEGLIDSPSNNRNNDVDRRPRKPVQSIPTKIIPQKSNLTPGAINNQLNKARSRNRILLGMLIFILVGIFCAVKLDRSVISTVINSVKMKDHTTNTTDASTNGDTSSSTTADEIMELIPDEVDEASVDVSEVECADKWGCWKFYDGDKGNRPKFNYYSKFPNKDVKAEAFPPNAWQPDAVYVNHFIDEAVKLVTRAKEAIFEEYGRGEPRTPEQTIEAHQMFHLQMLNLTGGESANKRSEFLTQGGWTTERSFESLSRRLLHAMMTKDTFTVVMGGHSAAAGHGNHFSQSYMMQFHDVMEPVFEHLGMKLTSRNIGQGGLGTIQTALGAQSLYGDEVDIIVWDSHMTESGKPDFDFFCRQALLGSKRAPFVLGLGAEFDVLRMLHEEAGADVAGLGSGTSGLLVTQDEKQAETVPWAARYLNCAKERADLCGNPNRYASKCWVDREDVIPPTKQRDMVGGQASWHPGFRTHRLTGRVMAFLVLQALEAALLKWSEVTITEGMPLADDYWHMSDYYELIQKKVKEMPPSFCEEGSADRYPARLCRIPLKGRTEYTPRANPDETSIRSILKAAPNGYIPAVEAPLYEGDDVPNPATALPEGAIDVRSILSRRLNRTGRLLFNEKQTTYKDEHASLQVFAKDLGEIAEYQNARKTADIITPGLGWMVHTNSIGFCDGSAKSRCGRGKSLDCLLSGHNDGRGGIEGDGLSGWLVMNLEGVKEGMIMMNIDFFHGKVPRTEGWTEVNDGNYTRRYLAEEDDGHHRDLVAYLPPADNTIFEFALNGKITTWSKEELASQTKIAQRVVYWAVLLDDENMAKSGKAENFEVAVRLIGCGRDCMISVNHVYWA